MEFLGLAALAAIFFFIMLLVIIGVVIRMVKNSIRKAADRAITGVIGAGSGIMGQAVSQVVSYGAQEVVKGAKSMAEDMKRRDPQWVTTQVNQMAQRNKGELTVAQVISELSTTESMATSALDILVLKNVCFVKYSSEEKVKIYIFPGFKEKEEIKKCEYCSSTYGQEEDLDKCPNCGAALVTTTILKDRLE